MARDSQLALHCVPQNCFTLPIRSSSVNLKKNFVRVLSSKVHPVEFL